MLESRINIRKGRLTMDAYVYCAAMYCEECAMLIRQELSEAGGVDHQDTDTWPQGPYDDGGGEADSPQHCDTCQVFLENPLTTEGYEYVREAIEEESGAVIEQWHDFYGGDTELF
jgi:hypothetical protein